MGKIKNGSKAKLGEEGGSEPYLKNSIEISAF